MIDLALGLRTKESARKRFIGYETVKAARQSAYAKLGAKNGYEAVAIYVRLESGGMRCSQCSQRQK